MSGTINNFPATEQISQQKAVAFELLRGPSGTVVSWRNDGETDGTNPGRHIAPKGCSLKELGALAALGVVGGTGAGGFELLLDGSLGVGASDHLIAIDGLFYTIEATMFTAGVIGMYCLSKKRPNQAAPNLPANSASIATDSATGYHQIPTEHTVFDWERRSAELDGAVSLPDIIISALINPDDLPEEIGVGTAVVSISRFDELIADINTSEDRTQVDKLSQMIDKLSQRVDDCTQKINTLSAEADVVGRERSKLQKLSLYIAGYDALVKNDAAIDALTDKLRPLVANLETQKLKKIEAESKLKDAESEYAEYIKDRAACNIHDVNPSRVFNNLMEDKSPEERDAFIAAIFDALMELQVLANDLTEIENRDVNESDEKGKKDAEQKRDSIAHIHRDIIIVLLKIVAADKALQIDMALTGLESTPTTLEQPEITANFITSSVDWIDGRIALTPIAAHMIESLLFDLQNLGEDMNRNGRQALDDGTQVLGPSTISAMRETIMSSDKEMHQLIEPSDLSRILQYLQQFTIGKNRILLENRLKGSISDGPEREEFQNKTVAEMYLAFDLMKRCAQLLEEHMHELGDEGLHDHFSDGPLSSIPEVRSREYNNAINTQAAEGLKIVDTPTDDSNKSIKPEGGSQLSLDDEQVILDRAQLYIDLSVLYSFNMWPPKDELKALEQKIRRSDEQVVGTKFEEFFKQGKKETLHQYNVRLSNSLRRGKLLTAEEVRQSRPIKRAVRAIRKKIQPSSSS